jgi:hypothetical protein
MLLLVLALQSAASPTHAALRLGNPARPERASGAAMIETSTTPASHTRYRLTADAASRGIWRPLGANDG